MTDEQIIKALECHNTYNLSSCRECPLYDTGKCSVELCGYALDLINRQKAEISVLRKLLDKAETEMNNQSENMKKLTKDCSSMQSTLAKMSMGVEQAKAEAIKEFAERFKVKFAKERYRDNCVIDDEMLDNLVKEMVGDTE